MPSESYLGRVNQASLTEEDKIRAKIDAVKPDAVADLLEKREDLIKAAALSNERLKESEKEVTRLRGEFEAAQKKDLQTESRKGVDPSLRRETEMASSRLRSAENTRDMNRNQLGIIESKIDEITPKNFNNVITKEEQAVRAVLESEAYKEDADRASGDYELDKKEERIIELQAELKKTAREIEASEVMLKYYLDHEGGQLIARTGILNEVKKFIARSMDQKEQLNIGTFRAAIYPAVYLDQPLVAFQNNQSLLNEFLNYPPLNTYNTFVGNYRRIKKQLAELN